MEQRPLLVKYLRCSYHPPSNPAKLPSVPWESTSTLLQEKIINYKLLRFFDAMAISIAFAKTVVGLIGNVIALGLFLSPIPTMYQICKKRTVGQFSPFPYLAAFLNCSLWVVYGLPLVHPHSLLVLTINGSGAGIELVYIALFIAFSGGTGSSAAAAARNRRLRLCIVAALLLELAFVAAVVFLVLTLAATTSRRSMIVGVLCVVFGAVMYAAPLSVMKMVIKTKSVEFMPLSLSVASFLNAACWTAYALIDFDLYITIPNVLGVLFATAQLVLHVMYYESTKKDIEAKTARKITTPIDPTKEVKMAAAAAN